MDSDDWLFESIHSYEKLYMYDLQKPVQAADWLSLNSLVVCISDKKRHEILELSLPSQLCVEEENVGLTKDRDFQLLTGGFCENCMTSIHHIPGTRQVAACVEGDNSVEIWLMEAGESNLIKKKGVLKNKVTSTHSSRLCMLDDTSAVFGSHLFDVCIGDFSTQTVVTGPQECKRKSPVSNFIQQENCVLTCDETSGELYMFDPRAGVGELQQVCERCCDAHADTWTMCNDVNSAEKTVVQLSNTGTICVRDCRNLKQCVKTLQTKMEKKKDGNIVMSRCKFNPSLLAVTGFNACVQIYDDSTWEENVITPVFDHKGHEAEQADCTVNFHLWYPWKPHTLLSASSDGGLHIFQPVL